MRKLFVGIVGVASAGWHVFRSLVVAFVTARLILRLGRSRPSRVMPFPFRSLASPPLRRSGMGMGGDGCGGFAPVPPGFSFPS